MEVNLNKPPNPRAFPSDTSHGMTLRDYFAAKAMQALISNENTMNLIAKFPDGAENEALSEMSFEIADAMLKERMKDENDNQF